MDFELCRAQTEVMLFDTSIDGDTSSGMCVILQHGWRCKWVLVGGNLVKLVGGLYDFVAVDFGDVDAGADDFGCWFASPAEVVDADGIGFPVDSFGDDSSKRFEAAFIERSFEDAFLNMR